MEEVLGFINKALEDAGVPYEFLEWTQKITYPYFVGEYSEFEPDNESGEEDKSFILTGFYRGNNARYELEKMRAKIEATFPAIGGNVATLDSGSVVAVFMEILPISLLGKKNFIRYRLILVSNYGRWYKYGWNFRF